MTTVTAAKDSLLLYVAGEKRDPTIIKSIFTNYLSENELYETLVLF